MALDERLRGIREMLQADGYDLAGGAVSGRSLAFEVIPLENACEDCLVPKEVMQGIIAQALGIPGGEVALTYPAGSVHGA